MFLNFLECSTRFILQFTHASFGYSIATWPDLIKSGWLLLGDWIISNKMRDTFQQTYKASLPKKKPEFFGKGDASIIVVDELIKNGFI